MSKKWFRFLYFLPFVLILIYVNIKSDISGAFSDINEKIANAILDGNCVAFPSGIFNEREIRKNIIKNMPDYVDTIVNGTCYIIEIRKKDIGTESFYNLSHSSVNLNDIMAQFGLLEHYNKKISRAIICLDFILFDDYHNSNEQSANLLTRYASHMKNILFDKNKKSNLVLNIEEVIIKLNTLFSLKNFNETITSEFGALNYVVFDNSIETFDCGYYNPDGSFRYAKDYSNRTIKEIIRRINSINLPEFRSQYCHLNKQRRDIFEKLIKYLKDKNIDVVLFLTPHQPLIWDKLHIDDSYPIIGELNDFAIELKNKYDCKIIGTFNPYEINVHLEDFYDDRHIRYESLVKHFDFSK